MMMTRQYGNTIIRNRCVVPPENIQYPFVVKEHSVKNRVYSVNIHLPAAAAAAAPPHASAASVTNNRFIAQTSGLSSLRIAVKIWRRIASWRTRIV